MAVLFNVFTFMVGEQQQVLAFCLPGSKQQAVYFSLACLLGRNVVKCDILHKNVVVKYDILHKLSVFNTIICNEGLLFGSSLIILLLWYVGVTGNSGENMEEREGNGKRRS